MDPRRALSNASVNEEFIALFFTDFEKRPALTNWILTNYGPSAMRSLVTADAADKRCDPAKYGYNVEHRLKEINRL